MEVVSNVVAAKSGTYIVSSSGTAGDIIPLLGLTRELVRRGHSVSFLTSQDHEDVILSTGASFVEVYQPDSPHDTRDDVDFWRSVIVPGYHRTMQYLTERISLGESPVLIARGGNWAFRTFAELHRVRFIQAFLWPAAVSESRRWMPPAFRLMLDEFRRIAGISETEINLYRTRAEFESICFFPDWFFEPDSNLIGTSAFLGFSFYDSSGFVLPHEVEAFAADLGPFVLFSASSGQADVAAFHEAALNFCRETKLPTLVLTSDQSQEFTRPLERMMYSRPLPHSAVLPLSRLAIHNGGIGTVAQCIRAGVPQLITPLRYDQPSNARKVEALGLGLRVETDGVRKSSYLESYYRLVSDTGLPRRLSYRAEMVRNQDAVTNGIRQLFSLHA
jgi:rhamnosyltransferase subunit B